MSRFLARRAVEILVVLAIMSFVIYALIGLMPGDPIDLMISADPHLSAADAMRLKALYGLDQPLAERYWEWLKAALTGDFGYSRLYVRPALQVLLPRLGNTALLMGLSFALTLAVAWPLGILASRRPGSVFDGVANLLSFAAISLPSFWLALMLIFIFSLFFGLLPAAGGGEPGHLGDILAHLIMPAVALGVGAAAIIARLTRSSMLDVLRLEYMNTARAKGLNGATVVLRHGLQNALIPIITIFGLQFGALLAGTVFIETVFGRPGLGRLVVNAILNKDFPLVQGGVLVFAIGYVFVNLLVDLVYAVVDPRIRYG